MVLRGNADRECSWPKVMFIIHSYDLEHKSGTDKTFMFGAEWRPVVLSAVKGWRSREQGSGNWRHLMAAKPSSFADFDVTNARGSITSFRISLFPEKDTIQRLSKKSFQVKKQAHLAKKAPSEDGKDGSLCSLNISRRFSKWWNISMIRTKSSWIG